MEKLISAHDGIQYVLLKPDHLKKFLYPLAPVGGSVAEWLACWTQAQKARVQIRVAVR